MRPLFLIAIAVLVLAAVPALTRAQEGPDFTGRWEISQAKSSPGAIGNNAKVSFPSELIIQRRAAELQVEMRIPRTDSVTAVYKLDGSEITVSTPAGIAEKAKAMWDGSKLVIAARRVVSSAFGDFITDTKEVWTRSGNVLTIGKTATSDGISATETAVYDKEQP